MKLSVYLLLLAAAVLVQGCHHRKEDHPPDESPEYDDDDHPFDRKRRSVDHIDLDEELSSFFTTCMHEKTGSVFPSWRSVVDFVLRDTRWYSASDEQYCPHNSDRDPNSVRCWQGRLEKLVQLNSRLLPKAKECVQEYIWSKEDARFIVRGKRQVPVYGSTDREACLGISRKTYSQCVQDKLLTRSNLRKYPSLARWDGKSVEKFLFEHYSDCRIKSQYTFRGNVYTEHCPDRRQPKLFPDPPKCLSGMYMEIVKTASPLFKASSTCTSKYTQDKCKNVRCTRPHQQCDKNTGNCICNPGYEMDSRGYCVIINPCATVLCASFMECRVTAGDPVCYCLPGYERSRQGPGCELPGKWGQWGDWTRCPVSCGGGEQWRSRICEGTGCQGDSLQSRRCNTHACPPPDPCEGVNCPPNSVCVQGQCVCVQGYRKNSAGQCVSINPCDTIRCGSNMICRRDSGRCVCRTGFILNTLGEGCVRPDPCEGVNCPPNSVCVRGNCVCNSGFEKNSDGICLPKNPCDNFPCAKNQICTTDSSGKPQCICIPGFVEATDGPGCVQRILNPCATVLCEPPTVCDNGKCVCGPGFQEDSDGNCVSVCDGFCAANEDCTVVNGRRQCKCKDGFTLNEFGECKDSNPCKIVSCDVNMECKGGTCFCLNGFVKKPREPGCERLVIDRCRRVNCPPNSKCVDGNCECDEGFVKHQAGFCLPDGPAPDPCADVTCGDNMRCDNGKCECLPDFVPVPEGTECTKQSDTCSLPGANQLQNGSCVVCTSPKIFNQCPTVCYPRCGGRQQPPDVSLCITACRQNVFCECPDGLVERSEDDSTCVSREDCPGNWGDWGDWVRCTVSCGGGNQLRSRKCDGTGCQGDSNEIRECNTHACAPPGTCTEPKVFVPCPTRCPKTCENRGVEISCEEGCRQDTQCVCPDGMIERTSSDTTCVRAEQCPGSLCFPNPCKHGGQCIPLGATHRCQCRAGYTGKNCQYGCGEFCTPNGRCMRGQCVCNQGMEPDGNGGCRRMSQG